MCELLTFVNFPQFSVTSVLCVFIASLIIVGNKVFVIQPMVSFETNTEQSRHYKQDRYKSLKDQLLVSWEEFELTFLEFTTLGFISKNSYTPLNTFLTIRTLHFNTFLTIRTLHSTRSLQFVHSTQHVLYNSYTPFNTFFTIRTLHFNTFLTIRTLPHNTFFTIQFVHSTQHVPNNSYTP